MRLNLSISITLAISALFVAMPAGATPITGSANIVGNVNVSASGVSFLSTFTSSAGAAETGDFSGLLGGTIKNLANGPLTGSTFLKAFATFNTGLPTPVYFDLTYIAPGVGTLAGCNSSALGTACTPSGSPFSLFQLSSNTVLAALQLNGNLYKDSSDTGVSSGVSIFSTQTVLNGTIPNIVSLLTQGQSLTGITYSASIVATSPVPEPASLLLMRMGLVGAGLIARRKVLG